MALKTKENILIVYNFVKESMKGREVRQADYKQSNSFLSPCFAERRKTYKLFVKITKRRENRQADYKQPNSFLSPCFAKRRKDT